MTSCSPAGWAPSPHPPEPSRPADNDTEPPRLLVVDDDEGNRDVMSRRLTRDGCVVDTAADGRTALALVASGTYDIVLLDLQMPGMTGMEVLAAIRRTHTSSQLPVVMVTANADSATMVEALERGADDYITKPLDYAVAVARIRTQVARRRAEAALRESEERYALAIQGSNDGLWDWKLATGALYVAPRWKAIMGCGDEASTTPTSWFGRIHPEDVSRVRAELEDHLTGQSPQWESEHRVRGTTHHYRWVRVRGIAVRDQRGLPVRIAGSLTDITEGKVADALTGLPNRVLFLDRLARLVETARRTPDQRFAVLFLDIDRFKNVNDSLGHQAGDQLLVETSRRLERGLRSCDTVSRPAAGGAATAQSVLARFGGDEFAIVVSGFHHELDPSRVAQRLTELMEEPFEICGQELFASVSIGIAIGSADYAQAEDLLRDADTALYRAKAAGRNRWEVFHPGMRADVVQRLQTETELRRSVERGEFELVYQPIVSLPAQQLHGFEALLRWHHPSRGLLTPSGFLDVAEETGLILPIGMWVIDEVCRQIALWDAELPAHPRVVVAVNLSPRQLVQPDLAERIGDVVAHHGIDPRLLEFEITESGVMTSPVLARRAIEKLKAMGFRLSLDDFGTGYSSLSYLQQFAVHRLKIDRSFLAAAAAPDVDGHGILTTIVALARHLQMEVVAEGIETSAQLEQMVAMDCHFGQGYYFSRPVQARPMHELMRLLRPALPAA